MHLCANRHDTQAAAISARHWHWQREDLPFGEVISISTACHGQREKINQVSWARMHHQPFQVRPCCVATASQRLLRLLVYRARRVDNVRAIETSMRAGIG